MTIGVLDKDGNPQTIQTNDDLAKGAGASSASTLRVEAASDSPEMAKLDTLHTDIGTTIHADIGSTNTKLDTLHTDVGTTIHTDLGTVITDLATLHTDVGTTIHADIGSTNTKLDTLHTDLATTLHTDLGTTIHADLGTLHTDIGTTIHTDLNTTIMGILGSTSGAAVTTDAAGTQQQYLRGLVKILASVIGGGYLLVKYDSGSGLNANQTADYAKSTGEAPVMLPKDQAWATGMSNRVFSVAATTLTRPANTTAYTAADSISDNSTAGSVTALSATLSDTNDDPIFVSEIMVSSTDTGLAGKKLRAYLFNSDPTASSGVGAGDNAAYSQKKAGYVGSFMGYMETGFSDGTVGRLVPTFNETNYSPAGAFIPCKPTSGAKTLYIQFQAVEAFTPSANSTTIIGTIRGWQGRAS
jgi:hypothetical protein